MTEIFKAKTVEEAKALASDKFGVASDEIQFRVLKEAKKGFLGIGSSDAEVEATYIPQVVQETAVSETVEKIIDDESETAEETIEKIIADEPEISEKTAEEDVADKSFEEKVSSDVSEKNADDSGEYSLDNFTLAEDDSMLNPKAKVARDYIISVLSAMGVNATAKVYQNDSGAVIELESSSNGTIIGRRGETLDALQYLSSMIANKGDKEYFRITIDCFGYREKRKVTLQQLAVKVAKNVLRTGRSQPLEPMNPYERRVIHSAVSEIEGVVSKSVGEEPYRKIIISSTNPRKKNFDKSKSRTRRKPRREPKEIDLSTSFEKDYKKPMPEDSIEGGLYGKIEF